MPLTAPRSRFEASVEAVNKYVLYGLGVRSQIPLWGESSASSADDVVVRWKRVARIREVVAQDVGVHRGGSDEIRLTWPTICEMSIRGGTEIVVRTEADAEASHLRHLVSGVGLGLALYQRGVFTLHAGAVAVEGSAIAIAGPKGAGKSTLVAAMTVRGHALLSDDVVALDFPDDGPPWVRVGTSHMNLWPDSAAAAGLDSARLSRICSGSPKLAGTVGVARPVAPVPLGAIIVLGAGSGCGEPERLSPIDAFAELVGHSHAFRWVERATGLSRHLAQCRNVLTRVPVFRLERGRSLDSLPALARLVEQSVSARAAARPAPARMLRS